MMSDDSLEPTMNLGIRIGTRTSDDGRKLASD